MAEGENPKNKQPVPLEQPPEQGPKYPLDTWSVEEPFDYGMLRRRAMTMAERDEWARDQAARDAVDDPEEPTDEKPSG